MSEVLGTRCESKNSFLLKGLAEKAQHERFRGSLNSFKYVFVDREKEQRVSVGDA